MIEAPPWELVHAYWPVYADAFRRFRWLVALLSDPPVTSWYRDPEHNASVGGAPRSQHLLGLAIDLVPRDPLVAVEVARLLGLVAIDEGTHVHVQRFEAGLLPAFLFSRE